ncbi:MAG: hypothetical protein JWO38_2294 [Gemmataceae bacterium]|nr:hypothetical protein [Gemmataceae bacterium]
MGLERRKNGFYYYRSVRVGKRVVKRYYGGGKVAGLIAQYEQLMAEQRKLDRWLKRDREDARRRRIARLYKLFARVNRRVGKALRAAGWHQHKREWRERRGTTMTANIATLIDTWVTGDLQAKAGKLDPAVQAKAAKGDQSVLPAVKEYLDNPAAQALWGDTGRQLLGSWIKRFAGTDLVTEQALFRTASDLRAGLMGDDPDPLVRLLAERVVIAWVALGYFERWYARALGKDVTLPVHQHHQRTVDFAHRQLLAAARALAKVRRAKLPEVLALVNVNPSAAG